MNWFKKNKKEKITLPDEIEDIIEVSDESIVIKRLVELEADFLTSNIPLQDIRLECILILRKEIKDLESKTLIEEYKKSIKGIENKYIEVQKLRKKLSEYYIKKETLK